MCPCQREEKVCPFGPGTWVQIDREHGWHERLRICPGNKSKTFVSAAIPQLSRAEVEQWRIRIDDYLEDTFELTEDVKAKLDQVDGQRVKLAGLQMRPFAAKSPRRFRRVTARSI